MTYIVKADLPECNGSGCRVCEQYLPGFFELDGGVTVVDEPYRIDGAELAEQFCPTQCIVMELYRGDQT